MEFFSIMIGMTKGSRMPVDLCRLYKLSFPLCFQFESEQQTESRYESIVNTRWAEEASTDTEQKAPMEEEISGGRYGA
ncbi:hypothetical protein LINPERHAP2_LOCUS22752 [Linum perenne]